jgi:hypothetical protein
MISMRGGSAPETSIQRTDVDRVAPPTVCLAGPHS